MLAAIGEFERDLIKERAADGIARAKANGVKFGAKRKLSDEQIAELREAFKSPNSNRPRSCHSIWHQPLDALSSLRRKARRVKQSYLRKTFACARF